MLCYVIKMVPVVHLFGTEHQKGNTGSFSRIKIGKQMLWITSGIENPSKSEVIGRCGGGEKTE